MQRSLRRQCLIWGLVGLVGLTWAQNEGAEPLEAIASASPQAENPEAETQNPSLERLDQNQDGAITRSEFFSDLASEDETARAERIFARMDANGDGQLNDADRAIRAQRDEEGWLGELRREFAALDGNGDAKLDLEEFRASQGQWLPQEGSLLSAEERLESLEAGRQKALDRYREGYQQMRGSDDKDNDGQIAFEEIEQYLQQIPELEQAFRQYDLDSNGVIDEHEAAARMTALMQEYDATLPKIIEERSAAAAESDLAREVQVDDPVQLLFAATNLDMDGTIDFQEYRTGRFRLRGQGEVKSREDEMELWSQEGERRIRNLLMGKYAHQFARIFRTYCDVNGDGKVPLKRDSRGEFDEGGMRTDNGPTDDLDQDGFLSEEEYVDSRFYVGLSDLSLY